MQKVLHTTGHLLLRSALWGFKTHSTSGLSNQCLASNLKRFDCGAMHMFNCIGLIAIGKGSGFFSKWGYPIPFDDYHIFYLLKLTCFWGTPNLGNTQMVVQPWYTTCCMRWIFGRKYQRFQFNWWAMVAKAP